MRVPFARVLLAEVGAVALVAQHNCGAVVVGGGDGAERVAQGGEPLRVALRCSFKRVTPLKGLLS